MSLIDTIGRFLRGWLRALIVLTSTPPRQPLSDWTVHVSRRPVSSRRPLPATRPLPQSQRRPRRETVHAQLPAAQPDLQRVGQQPARIIGPATARQQVNAL